MYGYRHCNFFYEIPGFFFDQTFLGLEPGKLFPDRENLVSDIPAEDRNIAKLFFTVHEYAVDGCKQRS